MICKFCKDDKAEFYIKMSVLICPCCPGCMMAFMKPGYIDPERVRPMPKRGGGSHKPRPLATA